MDQSLIKSRVGKTPLIRAENLEKELGISKIYLKLEGVNPSGHQVDRLVYLLLRDALSLNKDTICMGVFGTLGRSMAFLSHYYGIKCVFVLSSRSRFSKNTLLNQPNIKVVEYGEKQFDSIKYARKLSEENGWYNATPGMENNILSMSALSYIAAELSAQVKENIDTVFSQLSYGFSVSGIDLGFRQLWIKEEIKKLPVLYSCTTDAGNVIYESYKESSLKILPIPRENIRVSKYNMFVINFESPAAQDALSAVYDCGGKVAAISDEELVHYVTKFKKIENIKLDIKNGYAIAGFMKEAEEGSLSNGSHVVLLSDGRIDLNIQQVTRDDGIISNDSIVELINGWLIEYTDPLIEIHEALENAFSEGFVLFAYYNGDLSGIAIVVYLGFNSFLTKYHLAYIATRKTTKGRGIATQLINKAIELSNGNISLHVEMENQRAIKLYKKMGFESSYIRMIHKGKNNSNA